MPGTSAYRVIAGTSSLPWPSRPMTAGGPPPAANTRSKPCSSMPAALMKSRMTVSTPRRIATSRMSSAAHAPAQGRPRRRGQGFDRLPAASALGRDRIADPDANPAAYREPGEPVDGDGHDRHLGPQGEVGGALAYGQHLVFVCVDPALPRDRQDAASGEDGLHAAGRVQQVVLAGTVWNRVARPAHQAVPAALRHVFFLWSKEVEARPPRQDGHEHERVNPALVAEAEQVLARGNAVPSLHPDAEDGTHDGGGDEPGDDVADRPADRVDGRSGQLGASVGRHRRAGIAPRTSPRRR